MKIESLQAEHVVIASSPRVVVGRPAAGLAVEGAFSLPGNAVRQLDLTARKQDGGWEVALVADVDLPDDPARHIRMCKARIVLGSGAYWGRAESDDFVALCEVLARLGHTGDEIRTHGVERLKFDPPALGEPPPGPPQLQVKDVDLPPPVQLAVTAGAKSVTGGGSFFPDAPPAGPGAGGVVAGLAWPGVTLLGLLPGLNVAGSWVPQFQAKGDAFLQTPEGMGGAVMLTAAGVIVFVGIFGWLRQLQRQGKGKAKLDLRGAEGVYLLDQALVIKLPTGCTLIPRGRVCGAASRQVLPPFAGSAPAIAYLDMDGRTRLHFYESIHYMNKGGLPPERERDLLGKVAAYVQAWRRATT
jgi:hypothetical protein